MRRSSPYNVILVVMTFSSLTFATRAAFAVDAVAAVPEPGILALLTAGAAVGILVYRNRRK